MNEEEFDKMIRGAMPPVTITDERLDRFIDAVLDKTASHPQRRQRIWPSLRWPVLVPVLRFAVPMAVAVMLGITVGQRYDNDWPVAQFSTLYLSTTLIPVGS